jgi:DNA-binding response OmpR family regulator
MALSSESRARFNLKSANVLVVEAQTMDMQILVQTLVGFGAKNLFKHPGIESARPDIAKVVLDLVIVGSKLDDGNAIDFVRAFRRDTPAPNRFAPVLMVVGHTALSSITKARDCGAHYIIAKPLTPAVMLERIIWISRAQRVFVEDDNYIGPDRRFKFEGPPVGKPGRRKDDLSERVGAHAEPNMSQDQIDAMMQPRKIAI